MVVLAISLGILGVFVVAWRPNLLWWWLLAASVGLEVIHHWYTGIGQYFPFVGGVVGALLGFWSKRREIAAYVGVRPLSYVLFGLYCIGILVSSLTGMAPHTSLRYVIGVPGVFLITAILIPWQIEQGQRSPRSLLVGMAGVGAVFTVLAGIAAILFHSGFVVPAGHRHILAWEWPFANKNTLGMLLVFAVPSAFALALEPKTSDGGRFFWLAVTALTIVGDAFSYARSAWIAALVGMAVILLTRFGKRGVLVFSVGVPVLALLAVAATGLKKWENLWAHGLTGRVALWKAALKAMALRPWFGYGPGNSPAAIVHYIPPAYAGLTPHDTILRTSVELGVVGLAIWFILVLRSLYRLLFGTIRRSRWMYYGLGAVMLASLAQQMVESLMVGGVFFGDFFFTLLVSLGWVLSVG